MTPGAVSVADPDTDEPADDARLVASGAEGSRDALAVLYRRHAPWLVLRLQRRCADRQVVDEVLQDTFVAVWRGTGRWSGDGEVAAWIWLVDAIRRSPRPVVLLGDLAEVAGTFLQRPLVPEVDLRQVAGDEVGLGDGRAAVHVGEVQGCHTDVQDGDVGG